jgi:hypothetical protein
VTIPQPQNRLDIYEATEAASVQPSLRDSGECFVPDNLFQLSHSIATETGTWSRNPDRADHRIVMPGDWRSDTTNSDAEFFVIEGNPAGADRGEMASESRLPKSLPKHQTDDAEAARSGVIFREHLRYSFQSLRYQASSIWPRERSPRKRDHSSSPTRTGQ